MPIKIPNQLPAVKVLESENIFVMTETRALTQDIRPLRILILNLMPLKIDTETQLSRMLSNTPLQIELELIRIKSHKSKNTSQEHMSTFYRTFDEICDDNYDGMIITGAPIEKLEFEQVTYWDELCEIMEWSKTHVHSTFHICWGAQAGLFYHYGIPKYPLEEKLSGIYSHTIRNKNSNLLRGSDDVFYAPHSRYTTVKAEDIEKNSRLEILAVSEEAGVYLVVADGGKQIFVTGHSEYDGDTLQKEYIRDKEAGINPKIPAHYFPNDDDTKTPVVTWRSHANVLYSNWLNYYVYQTTPYNLDELS